MNIIFDLGGVVFSWNPAQIIEKVFILPDEQNLIKTKIFEHADWHDLDRGTLERSLAIQRAASRTEFPLERIAALFDQIPQALVPLPASLELVQEVKAAGHKLFVLSNMHAASFSRLENEYPIWHLFDGRVISCDIKLIKPEPEIFNFILKEYGLRHEETIFIDDTEENLRSASQLGITTIKFLNAAQCRAALQRLNCL